MIRTADQLAAALGGDTSGVPADLTVDRIVIDSRQAGPGDGFVAVRAERDGHGFVTAARSSGAVVAIVDHPVDGGPTIVVDDTVAALGRAATVARSELAGEVIGITGSVGKTTTKDLAAAILRRSHRVTASEKSLNNEMGVPLTLLNAVAGTEVSVIEMGARNVGHIAMLCEIASPTIGVVTVVAPAHLEVFGSVEAIIEAKGELVASLPASGTAVLNLDRPEVMSMAHRTAAGVLTFGERGEVRATGVTLDEHLAISAVLHTPWGDAPIRVGVSGRHQLENALAAAAVSLLAGASLEDVTAGLSVVERSPWRMDIARSRSGAFVVNDSYNANPSSMAAALEALADLPAGRRVAVLGEMAELGEGTDAAHDEVCAQAESFGIEIVAVGTGRYGREPVAVGEVVAAVGGLDDGVAILVKGSRVAGLEGIAEALLEE